MSMLIGRVGVARKKVALTTALATTPQHAMQEYVGGTVYIPAGSTITTLTFYGASNPSSDGEGIPAANTASGVAQSFYQLYNSSGSAQSLTVAAGNCYALPADIFGFGALKIVADAVGSVELSLKG